MKIEVNNPLSKNLIDLESITIESNEPKIKDNLSVKNLLSLEPACNYVSKQQQAEEVVLNEKEATDIESSTISRHQLAEYRDAFSLFDKNQDGKITKQELRCVMLNLKQHIKSSELDEAFRENEIQDDEINFEQFVQVLQSTQSHVDQDLREVFRVFDKRNMGYISPSDLRAAWQSFGISLNDKESKTTENSTTKKVDEMISEVDTDGDGRISFSEFVNALNTNMVEDSDDDDMFNEQNI